MSKTYTLQAPEEIAKEYGGDKRKIAEAMQLGLVDPTAGILAGMFIDRIRAAQMQEQAPQLTVAQEVMGGATPPAPTPPSSPSAGGLEALLPPAAPSPSMAPAAPSPDELNGVDALPVPDDMFDTLEGDGLASGGVVALSGGGEASVDAWRRALRALESSGDYGAINRQSNAMGGYQFLPSTAKALAERIGLPYRPELLTGKGGRSAQGVAYQERLMDEQMKDALAFSKGDPALFAAYHYAGPNRKLWGEQTRAYQQRFLRAIGAGRGAPDAANFAGSDAPPPPSAPDFVALVDENRRLIQGNMQPQTTQRDRAIAELEKAVSPETREGARKQRMWEALAQFGFTLAQQPGSLLQATAAAAAQTLPMLRAGDEQAARELRADLSALASLEDKSNEERIQLEALALELAKARAGLLQNDAKMQLEYALARMDDKTKRAIAAMEDRLRRDLAVADNQNKIDVAQIYAQTRREDTPDVFAPRTPATSKVIDWGDYKK